MLRSLALNESVLTFIGKPCRVVYLIPDYTTIKDTREIRTTKCQGGYSKVSLYLVALMLLLLLRPYQIRMLSASRFSQKKGSCSRSIGKDLLIDHCVYNDHSLVAKDSHFIKNRVITAMFRLAL